jgi:diguanylate cyclase (GGDEF)-like protein/PAS domain S-box-containing protein
MQIQYHPFAVYLLLSALITLTASVIAWRRPAPGSPALSLLLLSMTVWSGAYAARLLYNSFEQKLFWFHVMYIGIIALPNLFLVFIVRLTRNERWLTRRNLFVLAVLPTLSLLLLWTNGLHHLYYVSIQAREINALIVFDSAPGVWYFVNMTYSYAVIVLALGVMFIGALRLGPLFRSQYRLILIGSVIPWASSIYYEFNFAQYSGPDLTPATFGISGFLFAFAVLRARFMELIPIARSYLIDNMQDGVLVLDARHRIVDINPAMERLIGERASSLISRNAFDILGHWINHPDDLLGGLETRTEMRIPNAPSRYLDLRVTPLFDAYERLNGRLIVFRDVTERKDVERKLRNANSRLQTQLIEIGLLQSQLREQAIRDPLTNLFNRRYLEETLDRELARAARERYSVCIMMIDIDHFKQVNDTYGHEAGDAMLKDMADALAGHSRRGDFACRFGGEEFVIVMPNINMDVAYERAEALRESLNSLRVPYGRYSLSATFSMGIACYPANGETRDSLLRAVDKAMYAAKDAGRDHIRSFDDLEPIGD